MHDAHRSGQAIYRASVRRPSMYVMINQASAGYCMRKTRSVVLNRLINIGPICLFFRAGSIHASHILQLQLIILGAGVVYIYTDYKIQL